MSTENTAAEAIVLGFDGLNAVKAKSIGAKATQERAKRIPFPEVFYFESDKLIEGSNEHDAINEGPHQIDRSRPSSFNPAMPSLALLHETGNPFKAKYDDELYHTSKLYAGFYALVPAVWKALSAAKGPLTRAEIEAKAIKLSKLPVDDDKARYYTTRIVRDVLRDLRLFGLAVSDKLNARPDSLWQANPNWRDIKYGA